MYIINCLYMLSMSDTLSTFGCLYITYDNKLKTEFVDKFVIMATSQVCYSPKLKILNQCLQKIFLGKLIKYLIFCRPKKLSICTKH